MVEILIEPYALSSHETFVIDSLPKRFGVIVPQAFWTKAKLV